MQRASALLVLFVLGCDKPGAPATVAPSATASAQAAPDSTGLHLLDPGEAPREHPTFAFVPGRTEAARLGLHSRVERGGAPAGEEHVDLVFDLRYSAADTVVMTVRRAATTAPDIPRIGTTIGMIFTQKIHPSGEVEVPEVTYPPAVDPTAGSYIRGAVMQVAPNVVPLFPPEAVGPGARWALPNLMFSLRERRGEVFVVERRGGIHGPTKMEDGTVVMASEEQIYRMDAIANGVARRMEADLVAEGPPGTVRRTQMVLEIERGP
ncbi:MAG: hypothetical protein U0359_36890 [Byssovorax sp.]